MTEVLTPENLDVPAIHEPTQSEGEASPENMRTVLSVVAEEDNSQENSQDEEENETEEKRPRNTSVHEDWKWNPRTFAGEFQDSLGNYVQVMQAPSGPKSLVFSAFLYKGQHPPRRLLVAKHRMANGRWRWMCGNGYFQRYSSEADKIVWETDDGRVNTWTRCPPPLGPVFFDPPPHLFKNINDEPFLQGLGGAVPSNYEAGDLSSPIANTESEEPQTVTKTSTFTFSVNAPEFVPRGKKATPVIQTGSLKSDQFKIDDGRLVWTVKESLEMLKHYQQGMSIASVAFDVGEVIGMQYFFYPVGKKGSSGPEIGFMPGELPSGTGIKFEFWLNGISSGPQVCLGKRQHPVPFAEIPDGSEFTIHFQVHDIFQKESIL